MSFLKINLGIIARYLPPSDGSVNQLTMTEEIDRLAQVRGPTVHNIQSVI